MPTYFGYARISSNEQSNFSIGDQETFLRKRADELGLPFEFRQEVGSGTSQENRPVFMKLIREVAEGDCLGVMYHDRFGRAGGVDSGLMALLHKQRRVRIDIGGQFYNPDDAVAAGQVNMMMVISQIFSGLQAQKARQGIKSAQRSGRYLYKNSLYGYRRVDEEGKPRIVVDEGEALVIKLIVEKYKAGYSYPQIEKQLREAGYRGRGARPLSASFIRKVMMNPVYMGYLHPDPPHLPGRSKTVVDRNRLVFEELVKSAYYPAIIEPDIWRQNYLSRRIMDSKHPTRKLYQNRPNELSGILQCGHCSAQGLRVGYVHAIHQTLSKKKLTSHYPIYTTRLHLKGCPVQPKSFKAEVLEGLFRCLLVLTFERPDEVKAFVVAELKKQKRANEEVVNEVRLLETRIKKSEAQQERLIEAIMNSTQDVRELVDKRNEVMEVIRQLKESIEKLRTPLTLRRDELEVLLQRFSIKTLQEFFNVETLGSKRKSIYVQMFESATQYERTLVLKFNNGKRFEVEVHGAKGKNYQTDFIVTVSFGAVEQGQILVSLNKGTQTYKAFRLAPDGKRTERIALVDQVGAGEFDTIQKGWDQLYSAEEKERMARPLHLETLFGLN